MARVNRKARAHNAAGEWGRRVVKEMREHEAAQKCEACNEPLSMVWNDKTGKMRETKMRICVNPACYMKTRKVRAK